MVTNTLQKLKIFGSASGPAIIEAVKASGEPPVPPMRALYDQQNVTTNSTAEFWDMCQRRHEYQEAYAAYWRQMDGCSASGRPIDGVILPVAPTTAVRAGEFHYFAYSAIANVLDLPAAVFPVPQGSNAYAGNEDALGRLSEMDNVVNDSCEL